TAGAGEIVRLVAAFMILWRLGKRDVRHRAIVCLSVGVIAIAIPLGLAFAGGDYLDSRNLIIAVVPLLVAGAIGLGAAGARRAGAIAAGAVCAVFACVLGAVDMSPALERRDWRGV